MEETLPRKCWKCGKLLTPENTGPLVYLTDPPKYACTDCDGTGDWQKDLKNEDFCKKHNIEYKPTTKIRLKRDSGKGDLTGADLVEIGMLP